MSLGCASLGHSMLSFLPSIMVLAIVRLYPGGQMTALLLRLATSTRSSRVVSLGSVYWCLVSSVLCRGDLLLFLGAMLLVCVLLAWYV